MTGHMSLRGDIVILNTQVMQAQLHCDQVLPSALSAQNILHASLWPKFVGVAKHGYELLHARALHTFELSDCNYMDTVSSRMRCGTVVEHAKDNSSSLLSLPAETLDQWQRKAVLTNPGLDFEVPVEVGVIFLSHFADEMLLRAVLLQGEP